METNQCNSFRKDTGTCTTGSNKTIAENEAWNTTVPTMKGHFCLWHNNDEARSYCDKYISNETKK